MAHAMSPLLWEGQHTHAHAHTPNKKYESRTRRTVQRILNAVACLLLTRGARR